MRSITPGLLVLILLTSPALADLWPWQNLLDNPGFEVGSAKRAARWYPCTPGGGKGDLSFERGAGRDGTRALRFGETQGNVAIRSGWRTLPDGAVRASFETHVRLVDSSGIRLCINWHADKGCLKSSHGELASGTCDWTRLSVAADAPPGATSIECLIDASNHTGTAFVDDARARAFLPKPPPLEVLCNQVGYRPTRPIEILVQSRVPTADTGTFCVLDAHGNEVRKGKLEPLGQIPVWGKQYFLARFEGLPPEDGYRVRANVGPMSGTSYPFLIAPDVLKQQTVGPAAEFYYYQRCGCEVPGWHKACHMAYARDHLSAERIYPLPA